MFRHHYLFQKSSVFTPPIVKFTIFPNIIILTKSIYGTLCSVTLIFLTDAAAAAKILPRKQGLQPCLITDYLKYKHKKILCKSGLSLFYS
jgi:hypothetical protein